MAHKHEGAFATTESTTEVQKMEKHAEKMPEWLDTHPEERESIRSRLSSIAKELQKEHGLSAHQIRHVMLEMLGVSV